jgi:hypothetical protein
MFVKPGANPDGPDGHHMVRMPRADAYAVLPAEGREVLDNRFWHRRLRDGDVVLADPPSRKPAEPAAHEERPA